MSGERKRCILPNFPFLKMTKMRQVVTQSAARPKWENYSYGALVRKSLLVGEGSSVSEELVAWKAHLSYLARTFLTTRKLTSGSEKLFAIRKLQLARN